MTKQYHSAAELVASVKTLLTLPEVYLQVKTVVEDPDSCLSDLVNAITMDQGVSARILKLVNSAYFHLDARVDNIRQAVNLLGMKPVHDLVLATTLTGVFSKSHHGSIDLRSLWVNSVRYATYSRLLGRSMDLPHQESLFVEGLLSNIGQQVMALQLPQQMISAQQRCAQSGQKLHEAEDELLGFNYAEVGSELLCAWKMPDNITEVVRHHINPKNAGRFQIDAAIVHVAHALTALHENDIESHQYNSIVGADMWVLTTGLSPEILREVADQARAEIETTTSLLVASKEAA